MGKLFVWIMGTVMYCVLNLVNDYGRDNDNDNVNDNEIIFIVK